MGGAILPCPHTSTCYGTSLKHRDRSVTLPIVIPNSFINVTFEQSLNIWNSSVLYRDFITWRELPPALWSRMIKKSSWFFFNSRGHPNILPKKLQPCRARGPWCRRGPRVQGFPKTVKNFLPSPLFITPQSTKQTEMPDHFENLLSLWDTSRLSWYLDYITPSCRMAD